MASWKEAAAKGEWDDIKWEGLSVDDQVQLLKILQANVLKYERTDGYERIIRHDTPDEAKLRAENEVAARRLTGRSAKLFIQNETAAAIMLTNLEALFGHEVDWVQQVNRYAQEIFSAGKVGTQESGQEHQGRPTSSPTPPEPNDLDDQSEHAPELKADAHARRALEHVADYKFLIGLARRDVAADEDAEWMIQMIKDAAAVGYWAGRRIQAASGKTIEYEALSLKPKAEKYESSAAAARKPREKTRKRMSAKFENAMTAMRRLTLQGHSVSAAAIIVSKTYLESATGKPTNGFSPANLRKRYGK